jgi:signal transduction histidine kinase
MTPDRPGHELAAPAGPASSAAAAGPGPAAEPRAPAPPAAPRPEAAQAREEALSVLAHDLKNPLGALLLGVQRLERMLDGPRRAQAEALVEKLEHTVRQAARLVERLADLARLEAGRAELRVASASPAELVARALEPLEPLAAERGQRLAVEVEPGLPEGAWDGARVAQALGELVANAIRVAPEGSALSISAAREPGGVRFAVRDGGPGLPAGAAAHAFEPPWRPPGLRRRGAGAGLPLVRAIAEAHGGTVRVESQLGRGATFSFTLPVTRPSSPAGGPGLALPSSGRQEHAP